MKYDSVKPILVTKWGMDKPAGRRKRQRRKERKKRYQIHQIPSIQRISVPLVHEAYLGQWFSNSPESPRRFVKNTRKGLRVCTSNKFPRCCWCWLLVWRPHFRATALKWLGVLMDLPSLHSRYLSKADTITGFPNPEFFWNMLQVHTVLLTWWNLISFQPEEASWEKKWMERLLREG